jgi:hypothetical protein
MGIADWIRRGAYSGTVDDVETQPVMLREALLIAQPSVGRPHLNASPGACWGTVMWGLAWTSGGIVDAIQAIGVSLG